MHDDTGLFEFASLNSRRDNDIERRALRLYDELIRDWAAVDHGPLPTLEQATEIATVEIDALCEALGALAEHAPSRVFRRRRERHFDQE